jgi:hypothetical protein
VVKLFVEWGADVRVTECEWKGAEWSAGKEGVAEWLVEVN